MVNTPPPDQPFEPTPSNSMAKMGQGKGRGVDNPPPGWDKAPGLEQFGGVPPPLSINGAGGAGGVAGGVNAMPITTPDNSFQNFQDNTDFLSHIHQNGHVPLWVHPDIAQGLMAQHGPNGMVVPHPQIDLNDLSK